jgi:hypothetical protein
MAQMTARRQQLCDQIRGINPVAATDHPAGIYVDDAAAKKLLTGGQGT